MTHQLFSLTCCSTVYSIYVSKLQGCHAFAKAGDGGPGSHGSCPGSISLCGSKISPRKASDQRRGGGLSVIPPQTEGRTLASGDFILFSDPVSPVSTALLPTMAVDSTGTVISSLVTLTSTQIICYFTESMSRTLLFRLTCSTSGTLYTRMSTYHNQHPVTVSFRRGHHLSNK